MSSFRVIQGRATDTKASRENERPASLSAILIGQCQALLVRRLFEGWPAMMDRVDDALFDLADRATDNAQQFGYFEAMRHVRLKRGEMETRFREALAAGIDERRSAGGDGEPGSASGGLSLSLVDLDDMEESLAVTNMAEKIKANSRRSLFALDRRMEALLGDAAASSGQNPFGPEVICEAFRSACGVLELDIDVRLRVLKLFDRHVAGDVEPIYDALNELLIRNQVLPEIKVGIRRGRSARSGAPSPGSVPAEPADSGDSVPSGPAQVGYPAGAGFVAAMAPAPGGSPIATQAAGAAWHHGGVPGPESQLPGTAPGGAGVLSIGHRPDAVLEALQGMMTPGGAYLTGAAPAPAPQVLAQLTQMQRGPAATWQSDDGARPPGAQVPNLIRDLRHSEVAANLAPVDQILIDVVAMMFDYILDDDGIPDAMKALIGRLQIPILKVAIIDKSFFARKHHPARQLLNILAEAAIGWDESLGKDDALYAGIESRVHLLLDDFDDDPRAFSEVLADVESFLHQEEERVQETVSTASRLLEGRELLSRARIAAREAVSERLECEGLPPVVRDFVTLVWRELLVVRHVEGGAAGEGFEAAVQTMDDLLWSTAPHDHPDWRNRILRALPDVVKRVREGIEELGLGEEQRDRFFAGLSSHHLELIREERPADPGPDALAADGNDETPDPTAEAVETSPDAGAGSDAVGPAADAQSLDLAGSDADPAALEAVPEDPPLGPRERSEGDLRFAIEQANAAVHAAASRRAECQGMGTTLVVVRVEGEWLTVGHVGDSRLYRLRRGHLEQITTDHSLREELIAGGTYTREEAFAKVGSNVVTRAIGADVEVKAEVQSIYTLAGDLFLACSDGLSDMVDDRDIEKLLAGERADLADVATALVEAANRAGGRDNITVGLVEMTPDPSGPRMAGRCDVGLKRSNNEDCLGVDLEDRLLIVADGMGGCNAGEVASAMAMDTVRVVLGSDRDADGALMWAPLEAGADDGTGNTAAIDSLLFGDVDGPDHGSALAVSDATAGEGRDLMAELDSLVQLAETEGTVEEIVLDRQGKQQVPEDESADPYLELVAGLEIGAWIEFQKPDGTAARARLAWVSEASGKFLFTDRGGLKVADTTRHGLAIELRRGSAKIIGDVPLFDRAMSSLTQRLRSPSAG